MAYYEEDIGYAPPSKLKENRSFWKYIVFTVLTLGIYDIVFFLPFSFDIDKVASRHDGKKTVNYLIVWFVSIFTFSIAHAFWFFDVTNRVSSELQRREIEYKFSLSDFWLWYVLGGFFIVGQFVFIYKLIKAMNYLCKAYNEEQEAIYKQSKRSH